MSIIQRKLTLAYLNAQAKLSSFMKKEKGGSELIAVLIVIGIVIILAAIFWKQISGFFQGLIDKVFNNGETLTNSMTMPAD